MLNCLSASNDFIPSARMACRFQNILAGRYVGFRSMTSSVCNVLLSSAATAGPPYSVIESHNVGRNAKSSQSVITKNVMQEMTIETEKF